MTEDQIERIAESVMNRLDRDFLSGLMTQSKYDRAVKRLNSWTKTAHKLQSATSWEVFDQINA